MTTTRNKVVIAGEQPFEPICGSALGYSYNLGERPEFLRRSEYKAVTTFRASPTGGQIAVEKRALTAMTAQPREVRHLVGTSAAYANGRPLTVHMKKALTIGDGEGFLGLVRSWIDFVRKTGVADGQGPGDAALIKPEYFECTAGNLIPTPAGLVFIDIEWTFARPYSVRDLVLRGLVQFCNAHKAELAGVYEVGPQVVLQLALAAGLEAGPADLARVLQWEAEFYQQVFVRS